jgi:glycosyltransferase involved in cell wall biosynthesis
VFRPGDREAARAELGLAPDKFVLLFAARGLVDSAYKGYGTLARALELLVTDLDPHNLLLVGLGAEPGAAPIRGVEMRSVPFVDEPATVATYLRAADVYVHPARAESFGLAILEAMACGTPVVASDVGGIPEVLADGAAGSLVAPDDPTALAAALAKLIGDADMRAHFSVVGAQRAAEQYPQELQRDRYLALYAELLADGRLAPPVST